MRHLPARSSALIIRLIVVASMTASIAGLAVSTGSASAKPPNCSLRQRAFVATGTYLTASPALKNGTWGPGKLEVVLVSSNHKLKKTSGVLTTKSPKGPAAVFTLTSLARVHFGGTVTKISKGERIKLIGAILKRPRRCVGRPRRAVAVHKIDILKAARYVNPLKSVGGLSAGRIDMGVDYAGSGPLLALGDGVVTFASNNDSGPEPCWGKTCWPGGGIVVYRLTDGPFAGKYVYVAENITAKVRKGQAVTAGDQIAVLHPGFPDMETGWASGKGAETLAFQDGHECQCGDPGGWSTVEGRNFDHLLMVLGAPSGYLQPGVPSQRMPAGWPRPHSKALTMLIPSSPIAIPEGSFPPGRSR